MDHADHYFYSGNDVQKEKSVKKGIAFFDFDGTITTKDTLLEFIKYSKGVLAFYLGFLLTSPYLIAYKLKILSNQTAKEKVLQFFFRKMPVQQFNELCARFATDKLPKLLRPKAMEEIENLKKTGITIVIVSASPENWIQPWAAILKIEVIATRLEIKHERLTGKIYENNCHGKEKVKRINNDYQLTDYEKIFAYGDSGGDKPMLAIATTSFYKPFR
jgi:phosphatidylglycerophosphatase C